MSRPTCSLPGCSKPIAAALSSSGSQHLTCGELHHLLLMAARFMAARFHPDHVPPHEALMVQNGKDSCGLHSCSRPPWPGHQWCSRLHFLDWLADFYRSLRKGQICKLPGCTRHVYVEAHGDGHPPHVHQFCGWRHCQEFTMLDALQQQTPPSPPLPAKSSYGHVPSTKSLIHALKNFALHNVTPNSNIKVDEGFFTKHPWELLSKPEDESCFFIARCKFMGQNNTKAKSLKRERVTKGHYHWKQQGRATEKNGFSKKYFTYRGSKAKKKVVDQLHGESSFTMKEYTVEGVKDYCLIKLCKGQPSVTGKQRNARVKAGSSHSTVSAGLDHGSDKRPIDVSQMMDSGEESSVDKVYGHLPIDISQMTDSGEESSVDKIYGQLSSIIDLSDYFRFLPGAYPTES